MKITYNTINQDIQERKGKIAALEGQQRALLSVDVKGKVIISPEKKDRAAQLGKAISELKHKNEDASALLARVQDISAHCNIPLEELHQLNLSIPFLEIQIKNLMDIIAEYTRLGLDQQKESKFSPYFQKDQMLKQARESLRNHEAAKIELAAILKGMKP